ncbi:MAG TPA: hypothetical protein VFH59_16515 [Frateuria sp.]|uniref:hypothetical protein n=1 Tax=Frateuria sp. TaxID=2211372 RepID=UPI002D802421|nr:hypothetical protein [Frateuria sp.]HET6807040.1 hypothetical protein [Frateuria sp.]
MTDVIDLLEVLGSNAAARDALIDGILPVSGLDEEVRAAILARDDRRLRHLLGATNVCCALMPSRDPMRDEPEREDDTPLPDEDTSLSDRSRLAG